MVSRLGRAPSIILERTFLSCSILPLINSTIFTIPFTMYSAALAYCRRSTWTSSAWSRSLIISSEVGPKYLAKMGSFSSTKRSSKAFGAPPWWVSIAVSGRAATADKSPRKVSSTVVNFMVVGPCRKPAVRCWVSGVLDSIRPADAEMQAGFLLAL